MTKERLFNKDYAKELMRIATGDLESARGLFKSKMGRSENILFLVEQAIEKSLKAVLCWNELPVPLIHDLGIILARFPEGLVVPENESLLDLSQFASIRRYEEGKAQLTSEEITEAIHLAERVLKWAGKEVS
jgi:HEPN domain-containing protein